MKTPKPVYSLAEEFGISTVTLHKIVNRSGIDTSMMYGCRMIDAANEKKLRCVLVEYQHCKRRVREIVGDSTKETDG